MVIFDLLRRKSTPAPGQSPTIHDTSTTLMSSSPHADSIPLALISKKLASRFPLVRAVV